MAHVLGEDWRNFEFKILTLSDLPKLSLHMQQNFVPDELISAIVGTSEAKIQDFDKIMVDVLTPGHNLSFAAYDKVTGEMAGVRLISRVEKSVPSQSILWTSNEFRMISQFLRPTVAACDIFAKFQVQEYADLRIASIHRNFRRQGLVTEMYRRTLQFLKESGFFVAKSVFTSPHTRAVALKLGFEELGRRHYREIEDLEGNLICPMASDHDFASVMAIRL